MDEDDDAFLYGESAGAAAPAAQSAQSALANGKATHASLEAAEEAVPSAQQGRDDEAEEGEDGDEEEGEDEEEDSDSDLEIIVDSSAAEARPPPGHNQRLLQPYNKSLQLQKAPASAITSEYTPRARPGQTNTAAASLAAAIGITDDSQAPHFKPGYPNTQQGVLTNEALSLAQLPEGPAPQTPSTAPRIDLDPAEHNLLVPPETVDGEPGPLIYHVDPTEMEEKPWRRPGADLTDWFNYGFDEESWRIWASKKTERTMERHEAQQKGQATGTEEKTDAHDTHGQQDFAMYGSSGDPMSQQMQMIQNMMAAASGMQMPQDQLMAFMGMGSGSMPGMMGMGGMNNGIFPMSQQQFPPMHMMQRQFQQNYPEQQQLPPPAQQWKQQGMSSGSTSLPPRPGVNGLPERPSFDSPMPEERKGMTQDQVDDGATPQAGDIAAHDQVLAQEERGDAGDRTPTGPNPEQPGRTVHESQPHHLQTGAYASGRGAGVPGAPTGPSRGQPPKGPAADRHAANLPNNVPTGPKNPGRRYNDRDNGLGAADTLDYGGGRERDRSLSRGPLSPIHRRNDSHNGSRAASIEHSPRHGRGTLDDEARRYHSRPARDNEPDYEDERRPVSHRESDGDDAGSVASTTPDKKSSRRGGGGGRTERDRARSERRRGASNRDRTPEDEPRRDEGSSSGRRGGRGTNASESGSRSQARTKRRAGASSTGEEPPAEQASRSGSGRSRKRSATDDVALAASPPRETRRRR